MSEYTPTVNIRRRGDDTRRLFLARTVSAQLHLVGLILAMVGLVHLLGVVAASPQASPAHLWVNAIFMLAGALVFTVSSLYHFLHDGYHISDRLMHVMETFDHLSIYAFIAACNTPFFLNALDEPWRSRLIVTVWSFAVLGGIYTVVRPKLPRWAQSRALYTSLFVIMGWTLLVKVGTVFAALSTAQILYFLVGGAAYSIGALVYALKRPNPVPGVFGYHELWHFAVMVGFAAHYIVIRDFYAPS